MTRHIPFNIPGQRILLIFLLLLCKLATAQQPWSPVGMPGLSGADVTYTWLTTDKSTNILYLAYGDYSKGLKGTVMKWDGTNWVAIGGAGFTGGWVALTRLAISNTGTPYIAFEEYVNTQYKTTVMRWDGATWTRLGLYGPASSNIGYLALVLDKASTPYVAYKDNFDTSYAKVTVKKWDGTDWVYVGNPGFSAGDANWICMALDKSDIPYVAYHETTIGYKAVVKKYDGTNWVTVGKHGFSAGGVEDVSIAINNAGTPYVAYRDIDSGGKATVMKYDGTNWINVGNAGFSAGVARYLSLAIDKYGTPYVCYQDEACGSKMIVKTYNGRKWVTAGSAAGISVDGTEFNCLAIDTNGAPFVAYKDAANSGKATVLGYDCPYPLSKMNICATLTDTLTGNNMIVWNGSGIRHLDSFYIYREDLGSYKKIGSVARSANSFTDVTATTSLQSYRYKLIALDSCGRETDIDSSTLHKTVKLTFNHLLAGNASISWNSYEGIPNLTYTVKRSNNGGAFIAIASFGISSSDTTYIDAGVPSGSNMYRIDIALTNTCNAGSIVYDKITSNTVTAWHTGIGKIAGNQISIVPNPADDLIKLSFAEAIDAIEVYSLTGKKLMAEEGYGKKEAMVDVSSLSPGLYILKVNNRHHTSFIKH